MASTEGKFNQIKSPQARFIIVIVLAVVAFTIWQQVNKPSGPERRSITYTEFLKQLDASNIKSISIQKMRVNGEFVKKTEIKPVDSTNAVSVQYFQTYLPNFQGEDLLTKLDAKNVAIALEPPEQRTLNFGT